jgi:hypothetical protein
MNVVLFLSFSFVTIKKGLPENRQAFIYFETIVWLLDFRFGFQYLPPPYVISINHYLISAAK